MKFLWKYRYESKLELYDIRRINYTYNFNSFMYELRMKKIKVDFGMTSVFPLISSFPYISYLSNVDNSAQSLFTYGPIYLYSFCFISIDICNSFEICRQNYVIEN